MKPLALYNPCLRSALGTDLEQARLRYLRGEKPKAQWYQLHELPEKRPYFAASSQPFGLVEKLCALAEQCLQGTRAPYQDTVLIIASTTLDISQLEEAVELGEPLNKQTYSPLDRLAQILRTRLDLPHAFTLNTACTSAANALLYAGRLINAGLYQRALILAFETPSQITMQGFGALGLLSASGAYRPFHEQRDGLILGEAYSAVMLGSTPETPPLAYLLGGASACDSSNLTTTREDGSHIHQVMQQALHSAQRSSSEIDLIKLHGTATQANDSAEANGVRRLFQQPLPACCVLKPYLGHTLGACGLSELLLLHSALGHAALPVESYADQAILPLGQATDQLSAKSLVLSNFFGFGGNNASLLLQGARL